MATAGPYHIFFNLPDATSYTTEEYPITTTSQGREVSVGAISVVRAEGNNLITTIDEYDKLMHADFNATMGDLLKAFFVDGKCGDGSSLDKRLIDNREGVIGFCKNKDGKDYFVAFYWLDGSNGMARTEIRIDSTFPNDVTQEVLNTFQIR